MSTVCTSSNYTVSIDECLVMTGTTYQNHYIDGIVLETRHANKLGQAAIYASPPRQAAPHLIYYYLYLRATQTQMFSETMMNQRQAEWRCTGGLRQE